MKLDNYISDLLYDYDCVVIPGIGAIIATEKAASIDYVNNMVLPPRKQLSLNVNIQNNDGLLASRLAESKQISIAAASDLIAAYTSLIKQELIAKRNYKIKDIGEIYLSEEDKFLFEPNITVNYDKSSYGLRPIALQMVKRKARSVAYQLPQPLAVAGKFSGRAAKQQILLYGALGMSAIPLVVYFVWVLFSTNLIKEGDFVFADLNPFTEKTCQLYKPGNYSFFTNTQTMAEDSADFSLFNPAFTNQAVVSFYLFDKEEELYDVNRKIWVRLRKYRLAERDSTRVNKLPEQKAAFEIKTNAYHVITGCFAVEKNAVNYVQDLKLKGYDAYILDQRNGLYRVAVGGFVNKQEALDTLPVLRNNINSNAWLVRK